MSGRGTFDDALDAAIDAVRNGDPIDAVVARYPRHAAALRPLLEAASAADPVRAYVAPTARLAANYARVESALGRVQWERDHQQAPRNATGSPWWSRRVAFASLSLPAGIFAFALLGAGGAAAATLAATTGIPERIAEQVEGVTPSWTHGVIPGGHDEDSASPAPSPAAGTGDSAAPSSTPSVVSIASETPPAPPSATPRGPQPLTTTGTIANIRGNTFELTTGDVVYKVQIDANTTVTGDIVDGATATVAGDLTGGDRLHATSVVATNDAETAPSVDTPPEASPEAPRQEDHTPPGQVDKIHTPAGQDASTKTPPVQAEKTRTPGPPATPPGQGNGGGSGNSGNGGNGGEDDTGDGNSGNGGGNGNN